MPRMEGIEEWQESKRRIGIGNHGALSLASLTRLVRRPPVHSHCRQNPLPESSPGSASDSTAPFPMAMSDLVLYIILRSYSQAHTSIRVAFAFAIAMAITRVHFSRFDAVFWDFATSSAETGKRPVFISLHIALFRKRYITVGR